MPKVTKICRVCGKEYEACRTTDIAIGVFRWQDVACSPACGATYLDKLNKGRGIADVKSDIGIAETQNKIFKAEAKNIPAKEPEAIHMVQTPAPDIVEPQTLDIVDFDNPPIIWSGCPIDNGDITDDSVSVNAYSYSGTERGINEKKKKKGYRNFKSNLPVTNSTDND